MSLANIIPEYDMHVHTVLCGHAHESATPERISAHAAALRMKAICFSEHVHDETTLAQLIGLRDRLKVLQPFCSTRLIMGGEVDVDTVRCDGSLVVEPPEWMEFTIGSVHYLPGADIMPRSGYEDYGLERRHLIEQWGRMMMGLARNPHVDMIGHPGAMIGTLMGGFPSDVLEIFREMAVVSAARGQFWDFNDLSFDKLSKMTDEYYNVLQLALDHGVTFLYGSDTHHIASLGRVDNVLRSLSHLRGLDVETLLRVPPALRTRYNLK